jgi:hypothetical protein
MANRDPFAATLVDDIYARQRIVFEELIAEINPHLGKRELSKLLTRIFDRLVFTMDDRAAV